MGHTLAQYEDRIRARLGDLDVLQYIAEVQIPLALEEALATFTRDKPRTGSQTFAGDGTTYTFDLTADAAAPPWIPGWSLLTRLEYPAGQRIPEELELREATISDAGELTLQETTPAAGEDLAVTYSTLWPYPTDDPDDDPIPDVYYNAVCSLAAGRLARAKGVEFARRRSNSVQGELITTDPGPLFEAAKLLEAVYTDMVLGRGAADAGPPPPVAYATSDIDAFPFSLFHRRSQMSG